MKKYLGNKMNIFCAIFLPIIFMLYIWFACCILTSKVSAETIFIALICIIGIIIWIFYIIKFNVLRSLYSFGVFDEEKVIIKTIFHKPIVIYYKEFKDFGIGQYFHRKNKSGFIVKYIYLSKYKLSENEKSNLNKLHINNTFIKLAYKRKTIDFLNNVLPKKLINKI